MSAEFPLELVQRMCRRRLRSTLFPSLGLLLVGAVLAGAIAKHSAEEGFDGRSWFVIVLGGVGALAGMVLAVVSATRWRPTGTRVTALRTGLDQLVWAYARSETTTVRGAAAGSGRVELAVTLHFADDRRIDLPDDGSDGEDLLKWIRENCPKVDVGYSPELQMKHGVREV